MNNTVRTESAEVQAMQKHWPMIRALNSGTSAMREGGKTYLPQWPNEADDSYKNRLATATLYPAFSRTVDVMASKPFSRPLAYGEDVPPNILDWCNDIDQQGRNLHAFAADTMRECVAYGLSGILVDYPQANEIRTVADAAIAGVRPYFARYAPGTILGWKTEKVNGADRLIQLRLLESVTVDDGEFGTKQIEQVRVLLPGVWQLWRKVEGKEDWMIFDEGTTSLNEIPFVFFYGIRKGFGVGLPPLLELAYQNVEHWQSSSDQQTILHVARVPILTITGADEAQVTVGAASAIKLPIGGSMAFVEHSGAAIEAGRVSIQDMEERMRQTGAELIVLKPGEVTATQVQSENEANKCTLQRICEVFEDGLDQCLQFMADWVGAPTGGSISLFTDFGAATLGEASAELLLKANQSGNISNETMFEEWKRRAILSPELEWMDEQERITDQAPALGTMEDVMPSVTPDPVDNSPTVDLSGIEAKIEALAAKITAPEAPDLSPIRAEMNALATQIQQIATLKPVDNTADIAAAVAQAMQPILAMLAEKDKPEESKPKTITITRNEAGQIVGAEVLH
jgi:hypothetical protein